MNKVIIDVGARDTTFPTDFPNAKIHMFEPNTAHFAILKLTYGHNKKITLNKYGLGEKEEDLMYDPYRESCVIAPMKDYLIHIRKLDDYIREKKIKHIDFLKIDTEAMDYAVLMGGAHAIEISDTIQVETWDNQPLFEKLLQGEFDMHDIGNRNLLFTRKNYE